MHLSSIRYIKQKLEPRTLAVFDDIDLKVILHGI